MEWRDFGGVITVCYGKEQEWESRSEARKFFLDAMMNSDGSERERYSNVYLKIVQGYSVCSDSEE